MLSQKKTGQTHLQQVLPEMSPIVDFPDKGKLMLDKCPCYIVIISILMAYRKTD